MISSLSCAVRSSITALPAASADQYGRSVNKGSAHALSLTRDRMPTVIGLYPLSFFRHRFGEGFVPRMGAVGGLFVVLAADVADYSSLIREDEEGTIERLKANRRQLVDPKIGEHGGRIVRANAGSLLIQFADPTAAVQCAVELQRGLIKRNAGAVRERRIAFRIGIDSGDATPGDDLVLRAVAALPADQLARLIKPGRESRADPGTLATRVAALAEPGGICISEAVRNAIRDRLPYTFADIGKHEFSIGAPPIRCYAMSAASVASRRRPIVPSPMRRRDGNLSWGLRKAALAASVAVTVSVWAVALWAWLGANSPPPPTTTPAAADTQAARTEPVASVAQPAARERSTPETPLVSSTEAVGGSGAPPELQPPLASDTDGGIHPSSRPQPTVFDIGRVAVKGKQPLSAPPETSESGSVVVRGKQPPSAMHTIADSGAAVVRGHQASSTPQFPADGGTDVVRGNRGPSGSSFSIVALPFERPPASPPDQE